MKSLPYSACALVLVATCVAVTACVSRQHEHFYVLDAGPTGLARQSRTQFNRQVTLRVTVPSLVDRGEMVLSTAGGVRVMDHERWAAPLPDLVTATLGEDIERRRADVIVLPRSADRTDIPLVNIVVEIDQMTARFGEPVSIETHWRVLDASGGKVSASKAVLGRDAFSSNLRPQSYPDVAAALSECVAHLADRLVREIPAT